MLTHEQRQTLLTLAREAITAVVKGQPVKMPVTVDPVLAQPLGAFVTLTKGGNLRGCIGYPEAIYPLYETIIRGGISAAQHDPRFYPVASSELDDLHIEISVLSPLSPITPEEVIVGTHGLVVECGHARGLLLPQVPQEWGWDREEFLAHTCQKAGLPMHAWRDSETNLYSFTAEIFSESATEERVDA